MKDSKKTVLRIAEKVASLGGRAYYVGGCVRDSLLKRKCDDTDIEIHGVNKENLEQILSDEGTAITMGESFGIYNIKGYDIDIAFPRNDKGLEDQFIGTYEAAKRRDLTINSLMKDVLTGEITDHFGGIKDIESKTLRHIDDITFSSDPLRVMRTARFACLFDFNIAKETIDICKKQELSKIAKERIELELRKVLLGCRKPSIFFEKLRLFDALDIWFPELCALNNVEQSPKHHAEGNVWNHTMMVLDEGAKYKSLSKDPFGFMLACLCHDFGKAVCTEIINGEIHAYGHETKGLSLIKKFLVRVTNDKKLISYVLNLCEYHMKPNVLSSVNASVKSTNKMFDASIDPEGLIYIAKSDAFGKLAQYEPIDNTEFLFERLEIYKEYMKRPTVTGQDLIDAGLTPDKSFSEILDYSHKLQLSGVGKESNLKQTLAYAKIIVKKHKTEELS